MSDRFEDKEDREVEEMLPWYVNGTLSPEERQVVEAYLERAPRARDEVAFLRRLREEVKARQPKTTPGEFGLKRLQRQIQQEKLSRWRAGGLWRPAAIAAALVILVQAGLLFQGWQDRGRFQTAGVGDGSAAILQLTFTPTATEAQIREALQAVDAELVSGPGALGVYRVVLEDVGPDDEEKIAQAIATLRGYGSVVAEVAKP